MKFKNFEELLDELLQELRHLWVWSEDIVKRMQENIAALDALDLSNPANLERFYELLKEGDDLNAEYERFMEETNETIEKSDALTGAPRGQNDKLN